ncbi:MAG: MBL fold metallo-hydrolase [Myxococcaceae bacterium]
MLLVCFLGPKLFEGSSGVYITVLPAGQGDSSLFEFPNGQVMLIDAGPKEEYLLSFLKRKQISTIDVLVLSHPDGDHIMGFFRVIEELKVKEIWHSGFDKSHFLMAKLLNLAEQRKILVKKIPELLGEHAFGDSRVWVLAPTHFDSKQSTNNNSMVVKIVMGNDSALWPGDLESIRETQALPSWKASVLKAPHHGSKSSSSEHLVKTVSPQHVIFCTQAENNFGFPNPIIKERWEMAKAKTWDTGTQGKIDIVLTGHGVQVSSFL